MHQFAVTIFYRTLLFLLLLTLPQTIAAQAIRIMCLGNSITQGDENYASYRFPLWKKLVDADTQVEFVGSHDKNKWLKDSPKQNATYKGKTFTNVNEGHWGWRIDQILNGHEDDSGAGKLSDWLQQYTPDYALIHLGTNDIFQNQPLDQTIGELEQVISSIRAKNGGVRILLAQLIPANKFYDNYTDEAIRNYNSKVKALGDRLSTAASPIVVVDQYTGFDPSAMLHDDAHPNEQGEEVMAQKWYDALMPLITPLPVTLVSFKAEVTDQNKVELTWKTASEKNNAYFEIQRTSDTAQQNYTIVGMVDGAGTSQVERNYSFTDNAAPIGDLYYRLKQVDFDGTVTYSKAIHADAVPEERMLQVFPTVATAQQPVTIDILLQQANTPIELAIYTINGTHVKDLRGSTDVGGHYSYELNVSDLDGRGLYIIRAVIGNNVLQKKFIVE